MGLSFTKKNVRDIDVLEELKREGGKKQTPFLIDGDTRLYESTAIVEYLKKTYGKRDVPRLNITKAGDVCPSS